MSVIEADQASVEKPKLKRKEYEKLLQGLQAELCSLQDWVRASGERIIDTAGKPAHGGAKVHGSKTAWRKAR
jgi:polyphosphate kinase 2 (PPK2 family)